MAPRALERSEVKIALVAIVLFAILLGPSVLFSLVADFQEPLDWALIMLGKDALLFLVAAVVFYKLGGLPSRGTGVQRRRSVLDELPDGVALFDDEDRLVYANDAFRDRWNGEVPTVGQELAAQIAADGTRNAVVRRSPAGMLALIPARSGAEPAEERPERTRAALEHMAEAVPAAVMIATFPDGVSQYANAMAARLIGDNGALRNLPDLLDGGDWSRVLGDVRARGEAINLAVRLRRPDGTQRHLLLSAGVARLKQETLLVILLREEPQAMADKGAELTWLDALVAGTQGEVFVVDRDGNVARALHKSASSESPASVLDLVPPAAQESVLNALARAAAIGEPVELWSRMAAGDSRLVRAIPIRSPGGVESLIVAIEPRSFDRKAEERLAEIETRSRQLFFDNPLPQMLVDPADGRVVALNASARTFYGYDNIDALTFASIDSRGLEVIAPLAAAGAETPQIAYRSTHVTAAGVQRDVEVRGRTFERDGNRLAYLVVNDVTDMKRASEALRESEARFRAVFEHGPVGIAVLDLKDRVVRANPALQDMLGYSQEALRSLFFSELAHPDDRAAVESRLDFSAVTTGRTETVESRFICRDGQVLWVHFSTAVQRDETGRPQFVIVMMSDISERKSAEQALRMSEERLRAIIDNSPAMITVLDRQGRHLLVNARFVELTGLSEDEVKGKTVYDYLPDAESADAATADIRKVVESGVPVTREERFRTGREERLFVTVKFPLFSPDGAIYGLCGISTDVTEHRQTEESLRQAQKMEAIGQLTGGVAHDFNNLLTVVQGNLEWLAERLATDPTGRGLVETALEASRMGSSLTQRLLAFSRKQPLRPETINLQQAVLRMDPLLVRTLGETVSLETKIPGGLWKVRVDPQQLENSLLNLALNARDAMAGGGKLTVELANETVTPKSGSRRRLEPGEYVRLVVADTGAGMSPEIIQRAFEPFFTTKAKGKGTGLGLSMVYGFVRQSGGDIEIESERGKGTRIIIRFPRAQEEAAQPEASAPDADPDALPKGTESVLVVEDDPRVRRLAVGILEWLGYAVLEADDGPSAIELLEDNEDVDIVFTDVVMPGGMSGFDVANRAREMAPKIKILFTSGYSHEEMARVGVVPNEITMLPKPYTRRELARRIRDVLDAKVP